MLALSLSFLRRNALRIGVVLGTFALVSGFIGLQQMREVFAEQDFQSARNQVLQAQDRAAQLGLESGEYSDLQRQELTTSTEPPPGGQPPFNEERIAFFARAASQEAQIKEQLETRMQKLLVETHAAAQAAVGQLATNLDKARQIGVEDALLADYGAQPASAQAQLERATTVREYRAVSGDLKAPLAKLSLLIADQETTNQLVAQYAAQAAAADHGDANLARTGATNALNQVRSDLQTARIFQMDVSIVDAKVQKLAGQLGTASAIGDLEAINAGLAVQDKVLSEAMAQTLPAKALTISLKEQVIRAYANGKQVFWSYVTTGRPGLETDPGNFKVYWKVSPWTMHSPWPKGSPYWYPDSKVQMVMWFNGGAGIHDAYWRSRYGPGTNFPHYDPTGEDNGTHGCVNVPYRNMVWLWNWTPTGTPVIVY
jgi:lipoprotein-anchoring transpeptidase ErfK/SrfK